MSEVDYRVISLFKIIGEPVRYKILEIPNEGEMSFTKISKLTKRRIANISQHLRVLRTAGIVGYRTKENYVLYYLKKKEIIELINFVLSIMSRKH